MWDEASESTASTLTHKKGMTAVTSARFGEIVDRYSNPYLPDTAAARLNRLLRNPSLSSDLVQNAIIDAICDVMRLHPERELNDRYIAGIAKGIHLERIFQRELHIPATLLRAGDAYERLRGQMLAEGRRVTASMEEDIWDKAVCAINDRQLKEHASGQRRSLRLLPLHDGRSPVTGLPMPSGGLRSWQSALRNITAGSVPLSEGTDRFMTDSGVWDDPEYFTQTEDFVPTMDWLRDHGVTPRMVATMSDEQILDAGFDPDSFRALASSIAPPRLDKTDVLAAVLKDRDLAVSLAGRYPDMGADAILAKAGMALRMARTGTAFEKRLLMESESSPQRVWDEECARLNGCSRPRGSTPGPAGLRDYLLAARCMSHDLSVRLEENGAKEA